jgi:SAM-dependent methyltransferase
LWYGTHDYAYDISERMVALAPKLPNVNYTVGGALAIPFLKEYADYALSMIVVQHMPRRTFMQYLAACHEALRPGAIFCTQLPYGEFDQPDTETLLIRGYTPEWIERNITKTLWDVVANVEPLMGSELWHWLVMRRR